MAYMTYQNIKNKVMSRIDRILPDASYKLVKYFE